MVRHRVNLHARLDGVHGKHGHVLHHACHCASHHVAAERQPVALVHLRVHRRRHRTVAAAAAIQSTPSVVCATRRVADGASPSAERSSTVLAFIAGCCVWCAAREACCSPGTTRYAPSTFPRGLPHAQCNGPPNLVSARAAHLGGSTITAAPIQHHARSPSPPRRRRKDSSLSDRAYSLTLLASIRGGSVSLSRTRVRPTTRGDSGVALGSRAARELRRRLTLVSTSTQYAVRRFRAPEGSSWT